MRIINLIENTEGVPGCLFGHGLSFYIETAGHRLLLDLGPSDAVLENAARLGIDLKAVDTVILSHGHYDHSGGILPFARINSRAAIYMRRTADGAYYEDLGAASEGERYRYIGIDKAICSLSRVRVCKGDVELDEELSLLTVKQRTHELPFSNRSLMVKIGDAYIRDQFEHEQFLVISENGRRILLSGCAHNGILSILDAFSRKYGAAPDAVISGFHLMKQGEYTKGEREEIGRIAEALRKLPTKLITCHCTGLPAYLLMKEILGEQLSYVHSGEEIIV